jgi:hypothetical protein
MIKKGAIKRGAVDVMRSYHDMYIHDGFAVTFNYRLIRTVFRDVVILRHDNTYSSHVLDQIIECNSDLSNLHIYCQLLAFLKIAILLILPKCNYLF